MARLFAPLSIQSYILVHGRAEIKSGTKPLVFIPAAEGIAVTRRVVGSVDNAALDNDLHYVIRLTVHFAAVERIGDCRSALHHDVPGVIVVKAAVGTQRVSGTVFGHEQRGSDIDIVIKQRSLLFRIGRNARYAVIKIHPSAGVEAVAFRLSGYCAACDNDILRSVKPVALRTDDAEISVERQRADIDINAVREHLLRGQFAASGDSQIHPVRVNQRTLVAVDAGKRRNAIEVQNGVFRVEAHLAVAQNIILIFVGHLHAAYPQLIGITVFGGQGHAFVQRERNAGCKNVCYRTYSSSPAGEIFIVRWRKGVCGKGKSISLCKINVVHRAAAGAGVKADLDALIPAERTPKPR